MRQANPYDGVLRAVCTCKGGGCAPLEVQESDFLIWEVRTDGLCRALAAVFEAVPARGQVVLPAGARLVGDWPRDGGNRRSVFLCLPYDQDSESVTAAGLLADHRDFILLAPAALPGCAAALKAKGCRFVDLSSAVRVSDDGRLSLADAPWRVIGVAVGDLAVDDPAQQAALVKLMVWAQTMDASPRIKPPDHFTVLTLYCKDEFSTTQIANRYPRASVSTVKNRLATLEKSAGGSLKRFRHMSGVFDQFEKTREETGNASKAFRKGIAR